MNSKIIIGIISFIICSCSANWHIKKAIKKDPSIQTEIVDTIQFEFTRFDTIYRSDSTYYIEKHTYTHDTIVSYKTIQFDDSKLKSWFQILQENKTERKKIKNARKQNQTEIRQDAKTDRTDIRQEGKTDRKGSWWWLWLIIGAVLGIFVLKASSKAMDVLKD